MSSQKSQIPVFEDNPRQGAATKFIRRMEIKQIDVLVSVNYRFLIDADLITYPKIMSLNIHGSLYLRYRVGRHLFGRSSTARLRQG